MLVGVITSSTLLGVLLLGFQNCSTLSTAPGAQPQASSDRAGKKIVSANCNDFATILPPETFSETCLAALQAQMEVGLVDGYRNLVEYQGPSQSQASEQMRYWIYLPQGQKIDISHEGNWVYPVGTRIWQEISLKGEKIETREMEKLTSGMGPAAWRFASYLWRTDQGDATALKPSLESLPKRQVSDLLISQLNTPYKVGHVGQCTSCHSTAKDAVLGLNSSKLSSLPSFWTTVRRAALDKDESAAE